MSQHTRLTATAVSAVLLLGTAACGSGDDDSGSDGKASAKVTVKHKYGSTEVPVDPERVVTVGLTDQDALLALGKVPVGTTEWLGGFKGAIGPWAADKLGGKAAPTVLKDTGTGPQPEKIAALRPDVILALYAGLTKEQYNTLSKIAPVVAQPKEYRDFGIPWQKQTETVGTVLGKSDEAKKLVADTEKHIEDVAAKYPQFKTATAAVATPYEGMFVFGSQDTRHRLLQSLGFGLPDGLDKAIGDEFGANISKERTDLLDTDALVWLMTDPAKDGPKLHKDPLYGKLAVVKEGREVLVKEPSDFGYAVSFGSLLSVPYTVDRLAPMLAAAVDGKPATKVSSPAS
ncbi:iron-siderophore ABC transporter substrate-binding protein [Streptomyces sp. NPDC057307]|uniref:iron-siderophore ABC transporter substrate-binding protein n=1 Tax=Streptomyces sp. NPDC057307 TaxID=3346096 RepID=UPI003639FF28